MIDSKLVLTNVRLASDPTFFPHPTDATKHRALVTVIKNHGKNKTTGVERKPTEYSLTFWGSYSQTCALYLAKGRAINVEVAPKSYSRETGRVKPTGAKEINRTTTFDVKSFEFSLDSKKELVKRINTNLAKAKSEGRINPDATITAEELIEVTRPQAYNYDAALAAQTGMYGNARVYIKGQGFLGANTVVAGAPQAGSNGALIAEMQARISALMAADTNVPVPANVVAPVAAPASEPVVAAFPS